MLSGNFRILYILFTSLSLFICESKEEHLKNVTRKGLKGKIVGGHPVNIKKYPFAVQFLNIGRLCGGVILNSWTITTSAHCVAVNKNIDEMIIYAGAKYAYDLNSDRYKVLTYIMHEKYNIEQVFSCDIALVFSKQPILLGDRVQKAVLVNHNRWMNKKESKFTVVGWGYTKYSGEVSKVGLKMTRLSYTPAPECSKMHNDYKLTSDMFCLYGEGERDVCKGDSGGGVIWKGFVVGLTSHGNGCAKKGKPSIYTNLWYMRDWIHSNINKFITDYCKDEFKYEEKLLQTSSYSISCK